MSPGSHRLLRQHAFFTPSSSRLDPATAILYSAGHTWNQGSVGFELFKYAHFSIADELAVTLCRTTEVIERVLAHLATRTIGAINDPRAPPLGVGAAQPRPAHH